MSEFVFLFRGRNVPTSAEQMQQTMEIWLAWFKDLTEKGLLKNPGNPLEPSGRLVSGMNKIVSDGPFVEKDVVGGFIVIEAKDLDHAADLATGCPILLVGGSVEVRPVQTLNT